VEIIKKVLFHERHLVLGPIIALENEKRAMGIKKDSGPVTIKEKISKLGLRLGQTGVASRKPQWELPEKKIGQRILKRRNSDAINPHSITNEDFPISTDPQTIGPDNLGTPYGMISHTKLGENMSGLARIDPPKLILEKGSSSRGDHEKNIKKFIMPNAARLEDAGPDSGLGKKVLELEERLDRETALREALEKTVQILQAKVRTLGQRESAGKGDYDLGSQMEDQFKWLEGEVQDLKQDPGPDYNASRQLKDARDQDYNRKFYFD
jgi:hypothetical protein